MNRSEVLQEISHQFGFRLMTPVNMKEECDKLEAAILSNQVYHPIFHYLDNSNIDFDYYKGLLDNLQFESSEIGILYQKLCKENLNTIHMFESVGNTDEFTQASKMVYGTPDPALEEECTRILNLKSEPENAVYDAETLIQKLEQTLHKYHLSDWKVIPSETTGSKVLVGNRKIWVNIRYKFSENDLIRLCAHEIGTHVLRDVNGLQREDAIFEIGTAHCMETEEGLAIYNEELAGALSLQTLKLYAARYLCTLYMDQMSMYELTMKIKDYIGLKQAVYVTSRIKAGLYRTEEPGGFNKDFVYLQGYYNVKNAIQKDPSIYHKLYYGRIALEDLSLIQPEVSTLEKNGSIILPNLLS